jgi:RimJ/RimL family protein N-acetyltransferase
MGRPIGFVQIIDPAREESHYWGDCEPNLRAIDIWIGEADCLNKGYGTQMMRLAIERCFADPSVTAILIDPLASNTAPGASMNGSASWPSARGRSGRMSVWCIGSTAHANSD